MKTIVVANPAGGSGKTSTTHSLATAMAEYGKKVLSIDADPGAFLSFVCGVENPRYTSFEFFSDPSKLEFAAVTTADRFSLIPSASRLGNWEPANLTSVKTSLAAYDIVIIDTPTGPSQILLATLEIADLIIAPVMRNIHSIRGVLNLRDFNQALARPISLLDIAAGEWDEDLRALLEAEFSIIEPAITFEEAIPKSQVSGGSLLSFAPRSKAASDLREVAYLLLEEFGLL